MKANFLVAALTLVVVGAALALFVHEQPTPSPGITADAVPTASTTAPTPPPSTTIPITEQVGALFLIGHWADTPVASTTALIARHHLSGVVIMSAPEDPQEIAQWVADWNKVSDTPLIIAIDQEGGSVTRLRGPAFIKTSQREVTSTSTAYTVGHARGTELATLGINLNFAPVLDSATNPDSFMYDRVFPIRASSSALAAAMIDGLASAGVVGATKHFPGHPDTPEDSHHTLPIVDIARDELDTFAAPFASLITTTPPQALMTAHVLFPKITDVPATMSPFFLTEYLREDLGYRGVVITDDMIMDAIDTTWNSDEASVQALAAGADLVLYAAEPEKVSTAIATALTATTDTSLPLARVTESYERVLHLRKSFTDQD